MKEWQFDVPAFSVEHQVRLSLEARIDRNRLAGSNHWLRVAVNGTYLTKPDLLNKVNEFKLRRGIDLLWVKGDRWRVLYSPDFQAAIVQKDNVYACPDADPYRFVWDVTRYVQPGANTLRIQHLHVLVKPSTLVLRNVKVEVGKPISAPTDDAAAPAPTGALPTYVAKSPQEVPIDVVVSRVGAVRVHVGKWIFEVGTRTGLPGGRWQEAEGAEVAELAEPGDSASVKWETPIYRVERRATLRPDHLHVADTFRNLTSKLIGIIVEHRYPWPTRMTEEVRVSGRPAFGEKTQSLNSAHPSVFAGWRGMGFGLVAEDDLFRVHCLSFSDREGMGLKDRMLGVEPGREVTLEWSAYPVPQGDYWDFVNAVRRNWDTNFTIPGPFCFVGSYREKGWSGPQWAEWVRSRGLRLVCGGIAKYPNGKYAHGTGIEHAPNYVSREADWVSKLHAAAPEVKVFSYFHAQCCTEPGGEEKYADSRLIDAKGVHLNYPYRYSLPLYLPTRENTYGKALWGYVGACLDTVRVDGLYWDEMSHSVLRFAEHAPWDGCTVLINGKTHEVIRKTTSVPLIMQPLKLEIVRHVRERGKLLMANTQAATRTMLRQKIVRFVETGSYSAVANTHLGCPLGLGNHHPEKTHADSTLNIRRILEYGGVYYGHIYYRDPAPWNCTAVMFPITPVELREGVVLGQERIHTARSGRFGWPDGAAAEVYVVNSEGARAEARMVRELSEKGRRLYEIRMPSDHFAVLVKR